MVVKKDEETGVSFGTELTIYDVASLSEKFSGELASSDPLTIDLSSIEVVDGAGMQLLINFLLAARQQQKTIKVAGLSKELAGALGLLGLLNLTYNAGARG